MSDTFSFSGRRNQFKTPGTGKSVELSQSDISRVLPRQTSTGMTRGEQTIKGLIRIADSNGTVRMIMGFKKDSF